MKYYQKLETDSSSSSFIYNSTISDEYIDNICLYPPIMSLPVPSMSSYNLDNSNKNLSDIKIILPQICISRVDINIPKYVIFKLFCRLKIGFIENISEFPIKDNEEYKRVIVRVKWNMNQPRVKQIMERFMQQKTIKIIYSNNPWFWVCKPFYEH